MNDERRDLLRSARALLAWQGELGLRGLDGLGPAVVERAPAAEPVAPPMRPDEPPAADDPRAAAKRIIAALDDGGPGHAAAKATRTRPHPVLAAVPAELRGIRQELGDCTRCKLHKGRTNIVFGVGSPRARLMFIGEAPGRDEDLLGEPFVGAAGQLLDKMIKAMGLSRSEVYIANVLKCRPPQNRDPEPDEVLACEPFLKRQIATVGPEVIVTLGRIAAQHLLGEKTPVSRLRGRWREYEGTPLLPTFHPAYLLRTPGDKKLAWDDLREVMRKLGLPEPHKG